MLSRKICIYMYIVALGNGEWSYQPLSLRVPHEISNLTFDPAAQSHIPDSTFNAMIATHHTGLPGLTEADHHSNW